MATLSSSNQVTSKPKEMDWTAATVKKGNVKFTFTKMPGWTAFQYLEEWRVKGGHMLVNADIGEGTNLLQYILALLSLDREFVNDVRDAMFKYVTFHVPGATKNEQTLAGAEEIAFGSLSGVDVYEILARALAVNFTDFGRLTEMIGSRKG